MMKIEMYWLHCYSEHFNSLLKEVHCNDIKNRCTQQFSASSEDLMLHNNEYENIGSTKIVLYINILNILILAGVDGGTCFQVDSN